MALIRIAAGESRTECDEDDRLDECRDGEDDDDSDGLPVESDDPPGVNPTERPDT